jgi:2,3-dihydroxybenzoate decarboxylase
MLGKIALEECWTIPEELENNNPAKFMPPGKGDSLTANLLDIHGQRLQQMDENGVELMVLSFNAAGVQGIANQAAAEVQARLANDRLEVEIMKNPKRFAAFAALSMHDPEQAANELARCMKKPGFLGALLNDFQSSGPDGNTMLFYDLPRYDVFWKAANDLKAPIYLHPRLPTPLINDHMWKDRPWLNYSALGYADRLNMHVLGIITAGVLDRFPDVKLVIGHMGEHM